MKPECGKPNHRLLCAGVAAVLALSLAACGQKQPPPVAPPAAKIESAAAVAARQAKQAAAAAEQKKAEEQNAQAEAAKKASDEKAAADSALASKVKSTLAATPDLKYLGLDVNASDGNVTLFGTTDNEAQRRKAQKVAAGVAGVKSVKNALQIVRGS
jgi:hyperosmotically inducible periplasmic protein